MGGTKKGKSRKLNPKAKEFIPSPVSTKKLRLAIALVIALDFGSIRERATAIFSGEYHL